MNLLADHVHYGHGGPWFLLFPLFWLAVIFVFFTVFRRRRGHWAHAGSAMRQLGERYARGEIDAAEYRERAAVLNEKRK